MGGFTLSGWKIIWQTHSNTVVKWVLGIYKRTERENELIKLPTKKELEDDTFLPLQARWPSLTSRMTELYNSTHTKSK